jgi:hypothetical protein
MRTSSMKFTNIPGVDLTPEGLSGMSIWTAPHLTMLVFFCQPIVFGSWLPRIAVQQALGLGPACLALALLGRIGARTAIVSGLALHALAVSLPAFAPNLALAGRLHVVSQAPAVLAQGEA